MSLEAYIRPLLRWWRLIVIVTVLAVGASVVSSMFQASNYISRTTLVVGTTFSDPNPDSSKLFIAQQLAQIYADMVLREPIQNATMDALGINWLPQYQSRVVPGTQIVEISVTDTNPQRAQIIATELANQLILESPTIGGTETGARQEFIKEQLSSLQSQIQESEKKVEDLQKSLIGLTSASQIAKIQKDISDENTKLATLRTNYANFLANSQQGAVNFLSVLEPANLPTHPVGTNRYIVMILAGIVGLSLGTGAAYLLEFLDRTVKTASDIERIFGVSVIGYIAEISEDGSRGTYVAKNPNSLLAESFRMLQSNIEYLITSNQIKTLLITSPSQGNGKTTIASNLALSISQVEPDIVLVDADLRRSAVHKSLRMSQGPGLADIISNNADTQSVIRQWKSKENLKVITAGKRPPNVTEVVGSKLISAILTDLKENHELVIIDAPPLIIADAYNLASKVDGVLIVMEPGQTSNEQARTIKEQLDRANANILGFVFNKVSEENAHSYGDIQYRSLYSSKYYGNYAANAIEEPNTVSRSKKLVDFFEHGKVPAEVSSEVEHAIAAIKTQPRNIWSRISRPKKSKKKDKS